MKIGQMAVDTDTTLDGNETRSTNLDDYKSSKNDKSQTTSTTSLNTIKTDKAESEKGGSLSKSSSVTSGKVIAKVLPKSILTNSPSKTPPPPPPRIRRQDSQASSSSTQSPAPPVAVRITATVAEEVAPRKAKRKTNRTHR
ncbi:unnamed protein product, partial [Brenthis ino]